MADAWKSTEPLASTRSSVLFQFQIIMECLAHLFTQCQIMMVHGIIGDGLQLSNVYFAVLTQNGIINADIDDSSYQTGRFQDRRS